jgi:hypothetical protein
MAKNSAIKEISKKVNWLIAKSACPGGIFYAVALSSSFLKAFIINTKKIERINPAIKATATIRFFLGLVG